MPIRVEHGIGGIGGLAGYAAGYGKAQERKTKYSVDLLQNQQMLRARQLEQQQNRNLAWGMQQDRQTFETAQDKQKYELGLEAEKRGLAATQRGARAANLTRIPEGIDPILRRELERKASGIKRMLIGGETDFNDPKQVEKMEAEIRNYEATIAAIPPEDVAAAMKRDTYYRDETGAPFNEPGTGRTPWSKSKNEPLPLSPLIEQQQSQQKAEATARQAKQTDLTEYLRKLQTELRQAETGDNKNIPWADSVKKEITAVEAKIHSNAEEGRVAGLLRNPESVDWVKQQLRQRGHEPTQAEITEYVKQYVARNPRDYSKSRYASPPAPVAPPPAKRVFVPTTPQEFATKWAQLNPGQVTVGTDGKMYRKGESGEMEPATAAQPAQPTAGAQSAQGAPVQVRTDADYEGLPSGTVFIGPDGKHRRKP